MPERNDNPAGLGINGVIPGKDACAIDGCRRGIHRGDLMCRTHWTAVPAGLKGNLRFVMSLWDAGDANLGDLRDAQWACVDSLDREPADG